MEVMAGAVFIVLLALALFTLKVWRDDRYYKRRLAKRREQQLIDELNEMIRKGQKAKEIR